MDAVADVFQSVQIANVIQARLEASAPWGLKHEGNVKEDDKWSSAAEFAHFGMLTGGTCWLTADGIQDEIPLSDGDCFLFAPGSRYTVRDNPRTRAQSFCSVASEYGSQVITHGGGGVRTTIAYGWFQFCAPSLKLLARLLPPLILIRAHHSNNLVLRTTMDTLASEMVKRSPGSGLVVQHLVDILFVLSLRAHIESRSGDCNVALLRALLDPNIAMALKAMHDDAGASWTIESLAAASGMSRSAFALRFKALLGETPLGYLTSWRIQKAVALLQKGDMKLIDVARSVGYNSDAAFSKAFKRVVHVAPRQFRRSFLVSQGAV